MIPLVWYARLWRRRGPVLMHGAWMAVAVALALLAIAAIARELEP